MRANRTGPLDTAHASAAWPSTKRVEVGLDLLCHDTLLTTERTDDEREATRQYVLATIAQIERHDKALDITAWNKEKTPCFSSPAA